MNQQQNRAAHPETLRLMKITFGMALDGYRPRAPTFDHLFCGPAGLVDALEVRLGLPPRGAGQALRVHRYLEAIRRIPASNKAFFAESLSVDPRGVGEELLRMRDELVMAGWNPSAVPSGLERIDALAGIEAAIPKEVRSGRADRLARIDQELGNQKLQLDLVLSIDPESSLPKRIRSILGKLDATYDAGARKPLAEPRTNLHTVQQILLGELRTGTEWDMEDDSFVVATAFSELTLAEAAARVLPSDSLANLLVTCESKVLQEALRAHGAFDPALGEPSTLRPIAQVLPGALDLCWEPLDPRALLRFLSLSVSPIPSALRHELPAAVAGSPGIGSRAWNSALEAAREKAQCFAVRDDLDPTAARDRIDEAVTIWLTNQNCPRSGLGAGRLLAERSDRVAAWATARANTESDPDIAMQLLDLAAQAKEVAQVVSETARVTPEELSLILEQAAGNGCRSGSQRPELGSARVMHDPASFAEPIDDLYWWGFDHQGATSLPRWTEGERRHAAEHGIELLDPEKQRAALRDQAVRPILQARRRVVLLWPKTRGEEQVQAHPILTKLRTRLADLPIIDLDREKLPESILSGEAFERTSIRVLPAPKRWVKIDPHLLPPRQQESFSGLNKFIHRPFEWVMNHKAKLRRGGYHEINFFSQRGTLLHRIVELVTDPATGIDWLNISEKEFESWLQVAWESLLREEGANFLLPGHRTEGQRLLQQCRTSMQSLIRQLREANCVEATANVHFDPVTFRSGTLAGYIDLLVRTKSGNTAVIDLKFGQEKGKRQELASMTALQLAVYAYLVKQSTAGAWPDIAYFILSTGRLLVSNNDFFPATPTIDAPENTTEAAETWQAFGEVWDWRRDQMDRGWVEFPLPGTDPTDESGDEPGSNPPRPEWAADPKAYRYDDFTYLTGWEGQQ